MKMSPNRLATRKPMPRYMAGSIMTEYSNPGRNVSDGDTGRCHSQPKNDGGADPRQRLPTLT